MKIILLGAPGSGKGTQSNLICERYNLVHISTGEIFRENIKNGTPLGKKVSDIIAKGNLCPDDLTIELVKDRLSQPDCKKGYLLDGFPRNLVQAEALEKFDSTDVVINLVIETEELIRRISGRRICSKCGASFNTEFIGNSMVCGKCGGELTIRKDDNPESIKERLRVYGEQTEPLIEYYKKKNKLFVVNTSKNFNEAFEDVKKVLD